MHRGDACPANPLGLAEDEQLVVQSIAQIQWKSIVKSHPNQCLDTGDASIYAVLGRFNPLASQAKPRSVHDHPTPIPSTADDRGANPNKLRVAVCAVGGPSLHRAPVSAVRRLVLRQGLTEASMRSASLAVVSGTAFRFSFGAQH